MDINNPYTAPRSAVEAVAVTPNWGVAMRAFVFWLVGASLVGGLGSAISTDAALEAFGAQSRAPGVVAVHALRSSGPATAATSAALASFLGCSTFLTRQTRRAALRSSAVFFLLVPPAALVSAALMTACALVVYDESLSTFWKGIGELVVIADAVTALLMAFAFAPTVALVVAIVGPRIAGLRQGLIVKSLVLLVVTKIATAFLGAALHVVLADGSNPATLDGVRHGAVEERDHLHRHLERTEATKRRGIVSMGAGFVAVRGREHAVWQQQGIKPGPLARNAPRFRRSRAVPRWSRAGGGDETLGHRFNGCGFRRGSSAAKAAPRARS